MIYLFRKEMKKWHSVLWAVFASLALGSFLGYWNYKRTHPSQVAIATVNGSDIKLLDYQEAFNDIRAQIDIYREYARNMGISPEIFLSMAGLLNPEKAAFESCLNNKLLDYEKDFYRIELSKKYFLKKLASRLPGQLRDAVGNINIEAYRIYLKKMNLTPSQFEDKIELSLERELFEQFVATSCYVSVSQAKNIFTNDMATKKFYIIKFPFKTYLEKVKKIELTDSDIKKFYDKNKETYRVPEKKQAYYWILNSEDYAKKITIEDFMIQDFYDKNKDSLFRIPPKVKVKHILFKVAKDFSAEEIEKILDKAKILREQIEKGLIKFEDAAKKYSEDLKTSAKGGLLDFFDKGTYDAEFERVALRLINKGDLSEIVKTDDGFEIIQLEERLPASNKPLNSVRNEIIKSLKAKKAMIGLKADIQKLLYESKTDSNAALKFIKENNLDKKQSTLLTTQDTKKEDSVESLLAEKMFIAKKKKGEYGAFPFKDDQIIYMIADVQKSYIPEIKDIRDKLVEDLYKENAKKTLKSDIKKAQKELINKNKTIQDVAQDYGLNVYVTDALKSDGKVKDLGLDSSFTKKAFVLNSMDQALTYRNDSDYILAQFKDIVQTDLISFEDQRLKIVAKEKNAEKDLYLQAFIASLLRTARIETFENFMKFNFNK